MENTKYGRQREGRWTPIRAKAQDTRANPNSWETHLVRKRWDIGLLRALSPRIMMMTMMMNRVFAFFTSNAQVPLFRRFCQKNTVYNHIMTCVGYLGRSHVNERAIIYYVGLFQF